MEKFITKIGSSSALCEFADELRRKVFIEEQGVPADEIFDGLNEKAVHIVIFANDFPVATARLINKKSTWRIGLVAVDKLFRGNKLGEKVMQNAIDYVTAQAGTEIILSAQQQVSEFYRKLGFEQFGEITVFESGFVLVPMRYLIKQVDQFEFRKLNTDEEVASFWEKLYQYHKQDLFAYMDEEEQKYFSGTEYYDAIMDLKTNTKDGQLPLEMVFIYDESGHYIGFAMYKIYNTEDGKAFILEFCIDRLLRNKGLGIRVAKAFENYLKANGATYLAINTSNQDNLRFWQRFGFAPAEADEWGNMTYTKMIEGDDNES